MNNHADTIDILAKLSLTTITSLQCMSNLQDTVPWKDFKHLLTSSGIIGKHKASDAGLWEQTEALRLQMDKEQIVEQV